MALEWHYQSFGEDFGPVAIDTLQMLVREGQVAPDDLVRRKDSDWRPAKDVPELYEVAHATADDLDALLGEESPRARSTADDLLSTLEIVNESSTGQKRAPKQRPQATWRCRILGQELGPFGFDDLARQAESGELCPTDEVRSSDLGEWVPAGTIVGLFSSRRQHAAPVQGPTSVLAPQRMGVALRPTAASSSDDEIDCYCRIRGQEVGPVPYSHLFAMVASGKLARSDKVRLGRAGGWSDADSVAGLFPLVDDPKADSTSPSAPAGEPEDAAEVAALLDAAGVKPSTAVNKRSAPSADFLRKSNPVIPARPAVAAPAMAPPATASPPAAMRMPPSPARAFTPPPKSKRSGGSPFKGVSLSFSINWQYVGIVVGVAAVVGLLYFAPGLFGANGNAIYEETSEIWTMVQQLHSTEAGPAEWEIAKGKWGPRVAELTEYLGDHASAKDRMLQLMLYCHRDCLTPIFSGSGVGVDKQFKEMETYMQEAKELAARS